MTWLCLSVSDLRIPNGHGKLPGSVCGEIGTSGGNGLMHMMSTCGAFVFYEINQLGLDLVCKL